MQTFLSSELYEYKCGDPEEFRNSVLFFAHVKKTDHRGRSVIILEQHQV